MEEYRAFNSRDEGSIPSSPVSTYEVKDACKTSDLVDRVRFVVGALGLSYSDYYRRFGTVKLQFDSA